MSLTSMHWSTCCSASAVLPSRSWCCARYSRTLHRCTHTASTVREFNSCLGLTSPCNAVGTIWHAQQCVCQLLLCATSHSPDKCLRRGLLLAAAAAAGALHRRQGAAGLQAGLQPLKELAQERRLAAAAVQWLQVCRAGQGTQ